jgi:hypothetical protein
MKQPENNISEVKLVYRTKVKASVRPQVKTSSDAFEIFMKHWDLDSIEHVEEFKLMLLTRSNKVLGVASIYPIVTKRVTQNKKRHFLWNN